MSFTCGKPAYPVLIAIILVVSSQLARAQYTKLYQFTNATGVAQTSVRAITNGLEVITAKYATPTTWAAPVVANVLISGVYNTQLTYGTASQAAGAGISVGWTTSDNSCRLRDLRWGNGATIVPAQLGGTPGGGYVLFNYPEPGNLTMVITNDMLDPGGYLDLTGMEKLVTAAELPLPELSLIAGRGIVQVHIEAIASDLAILRGEIVEQNARKPLRPSATSLLTKLDSAAALKDQGYALYLAGDVDGAIALWHEAAQALKTLISEVTNRSAKGNLAQGLYTRWIVDGGGQIRTAPQIREALLALPNGLTPLVVAPLPEGVRPPLQAGMLPENYVPWPTTRLDPGQYTAFVMTGIEEGNALVLRGTVRDGDGHRVLDWIEQGVAKTLPVDTEPPTLAGTFSPILLWPPDHAMQHMTLDVTVTDNYPGANWYVESVTCNQPADGTGDGDLSPDWYIDPDNPQDLWLRAERSGNQETRVYTVILRAVDMAGNLSEPVTFAVPVQHNN